MDVIYKKTNKKVLVFFLFFLILFLLVFSFFVLSNKKITLFKKAVQLTTSGSVLPMALCKYIPSSLYGASQSEWDKYECVGNTAKLKAQYTMKAQIRRATEISTASASLTTTTAGSDSVIENLQVPSIKSFASSVQTGDATIDYPIQVPPAAGGFAPSISLSYSSAAVEDMRFKRKNDEWTSGDAKSQGSYIGLGWNLSGIPQIYKNSADRYYLVIDGRSFQLFGPSGSKDGMPDGQDATYTTIPNGFLKIVRKYENPGIADPHLRQPVDCSGGGTLGQNNVDFRSWDIWTKDGKHYVFKRLGFIIKDINCSDGGEHNADFTSGSCPLSDSTQNQKRKRFFNKWVLTEAIDTSGNKIVYEYSPKVGPNDQGGNWQLTGNGLDECRDKCMSFIPPSYSGDNNWGPCTNRCFNTKLISDNQIETMRMSKENCNDNPRMESISLSFDCKAFSLNCSRRTDCQAAGETQWKDICLRGCFGTDGRDPITDPANHCSGGIFSPRAIYPVSIKYGVGLKTGNNNQVNKIEFIYSKRDDNNFGPYASTGDRKLEQIKVLLGNNLIRSYQLNYIYSTVPSAYPPTDSYNSLTSTGMLLLKEIKLNGSGQDFPVYQTYEYYPFTDTAKSLLLSKANNGYGGYVEYDYQRAMYQIYYEGFNSEGCSSYGKSYTLADNPENQRNSRARILTKTIKSSFAPNKIQQYKYEYQSSASSYCGGSDTDRVDCKYSGHWILNTQGDSEFLGYSRVKEILASSEDSGSTWTNRTAIYYTYNPGGNEGTFAGKDSSQHDCSYEGFQTRDPGLNDYYYKKGTVARKTVVVYSNNTTEVPISTENYSYRTIVDTTPGPKQYFFYPSQTTACSDLDVGDANLRKAGYSTSADGDFDNKGNLMKQTVYKVDSCTISGSNNYYNIVTKGTTTPIRTTLTTYATLEQDNQNPYLVKYVVDKPLAVEVRSGSGTLGDTTLKLSFIEYNGLSSLYTGKIKYSLEVDVSDSRISSPTSTSISGLRGVINNYDYDTNQTDKTGNLTVSTNYKNYADVAISNRNSGNSGMWIGFTPSGGYSSTALSVTTTFDSSFLTFPVSVSNPLNQAATTMYDFQSGSGAANIIGLPVRITDLNGNQTTTGYDKWGRTTWIAQPGDTSGSPTLVYHYTDRAVSTAGTLSMVVQVGKKDSTTATTDPNTGRLVSYVFYDDLGRKLQSQTESANSNKLFSNRVEYDSLGRAVKSISSQEVNGSLGNYQATLTSSQAPSPESFVSITDYDIQGRAVRVTQPDGTCSLIKYEGRNTFAYDPMGKQSYSWVDQLGRNAGAAVYTGSATLSCSGGVTYPSSGYTIYSSATNNYDTLDRITGTNNYRGNIGGTLLSSTTTTYDGFGRVKTQIDPDLGTICFGKSASGVCTSSYDATGNSLIVTDNEGLEKSTKYDSLGRGIEIYENDCYRGTTNCTPGTGAIQRALLEYDNTDPGWNGIGKLYREVTKNSSGSDYYEVKYLYDNQGRVVDSFSKFLTEMNLTGTEFRIHNWYNVLGKVEKTRLLNTSISGVLPKPFDIFEEEVNNYDSIGRLTGINGSYGCNRETVTPISNISYNQFNQVTGTTLGNGAVDTLAYNLNDKTLRLTNHQVNKSGNPILNIDYLTYDKAGNLLTMRDNIQGTNPTYTYDDFYRLTRATNPYASEYIYDELGRMTRKKEKNPQGQLEDIAINFNNSSTSYPLNAPISYSISGTTTNLSYDKGNLVRNSNKTYSYDNFNRLVMVADGSGTNTIASYVYDYKGQRLKEVEGNKVTYYLGPLEIVKENSINKTTVKSYHPGGMVYTIVSNSGTGTSSFAYLHSDFLSSTKAITDGSGNKVSGSDMDYNPYGTKIAGSDTLPTDHLYTGQISDLNTDLYYYNQRYYFPKLGIFTVADKAKGPNRYSYVNGNPIMRNDPTGEVAEQGDGGGGDPWSSSQYMYKPPLQMHTYSASYTNNLVLQALISVMIAANGPGGVGALAIFEAISPKILPQSLNTPEYKTLEEKIYKDTNFKAKNDLEFITSLTASINKNVTFNKTMESVYNNKGEGINLSKVPDLLTNLNPDLIGSLSRGKAVCNQYAVYENYLLGQQGIKSSAIYGSFTKNPIIGHVVVQFQSGEMTYVADPVTGVVMPKKNYYSYVSKTYGRGEIIFTGKSGFYGLTPYEQQVKMFGLEDIVKNLAK